MLRGADPDILLLSQVFPPAVGGSGEMLENVYSRITAVPVRVWIDGATSGGTDETRGSMRIRRTTLDGRYWGVLDPKGMRQHLRLGRDLIRALRERPTIVHCGRAQPEGLPALLARRLAPHAPYLFWVYGDDIATALTSRDFSWTMRRVHAGASLAVAITRNSADVLAAQGFDADRIRVVYPGVDSDRFHPQLNARELRERFGADPGRLLLSVGRLQRRKGHDMVLAAMHALRMELPDLVYVVVGDGAERARLEALTRELQLERRVHFEGEVAPRLLPLYYAVSDVFVLPTRVDAGDFEGFGLVFLEAGATAKPVIGGRTGGVPEAVADGQTGLLVDPTDTRALAAALRTLVTDPVLRRQFGGAARARVCRDFTWARAAEAVLAIHRDLARASGRSYAPLSRDVRAS